MNRPVIRMERQSLRELLRNIDCGKFAIPKLQREFVWDGPKAAKLFDSIGRGMPIGALLIWETPKSHLLYLRQKYNVLPSFRLDNSAVWFIIDGQQRLAVLYNVREGSEIRNARNRTIYFKRVVYCAQASASEPVVRYRRPVAGEFISLANLLHPNWRQRIGPLTRPRLARAAIVRKQLLAYPAHLLFVGKMNLADIRECFLRVNTQGMRVTTADAIFTQAESLDLRDFVHEVRSRIDQSYRGILDAPILWGFAAVHGASDARGRTVQQIIHKLEAHRDPQSKKALVKSWTAFSVCLGKAVDYLRESFRVVQRDLLYSDYMIPMLALFYYWNRGGPSDAQKEQIKVWFWATTVGSRYSGRDFLRCLPEDVSFFHRLAQRKTARFSARPQIDPRNIRRAQYRDRSGIQCAFYSMLLLRSPVRLSDPALNEIPIDRYSTPASRKDRHHIFPQSCLSAAQIPRHQQNSICNICLLTAEENQTIGGKRPRSYFVQLQRPPHLFKRKMERHLIPVDGSSGIWATNIKRGYARFIEQREALICQAIEKEAHIRLFRMPT